MNILIKNCSVIFHSPWSFINMTEFNGGGPSPSEIGLGSGSEISQEISGDIHGAHHCQFSLQSCVPHLGLDQKDMNIDSV